MMRPNRNHLSIALVFGLVARAVAAEPERFRKPAPLEDDVATVEVPVWGTPTGHPPGGRLLSVMEWVSKRTWHILGLPYVRDDFKWLPNQTVEVKEDRVEITATVASGGVPLRNQIITCDIKPIDEPVLILLRSTDAFGEVLISLDLLRSGAAEARSVTVSRSMIGGQSHSSPMPEQSSNRRITAADVEPTSADWHRLRIRTQGVRITLWLDEKEVLSFDDPDPAGGQFAFGSTGTVHVRDIGQWELVSAEERDRREACVKDMHEFCKGLDAEYAGDVASRNEVDAADGGLTWRWPPTGATATLTPEKGFVRGKVTAGLYGDDVLIDGPFPEVHVIATDGGEYGPDPQRPATVSGDTTELRMELPLRSGDGKQATATVRAKLTVLTVWFWTVRVEGVEPKYVQAFVGAAPEFSRQLDGAAASTKIPNIADHSISSNGIHFKHNAKSGILIKGLTPEVIVGTRVGGRDEVALSTEGDALRFATLILPAQPLNRIGFSKRMVHFIRYAEGPVQHWRRRPSFQEYPTDVDLRRYAGHGAEAMVWHHTWLNTDFLDREGFLLNEPEMRRAMDETHRLGMAMIGYIGIVPGRNSLLRFEDTGALGASGYGGYGKNWDLQDFTFYHVAGRWQEFLPWMTDTWCREYGLDGFYADGGLAARSAGPLTEPLYPEDAGLSIDELMHRFYYRVRKVLERHDARFGLEQWGGSGDMLVTGFYDCRMIGESFQETPPETYRDGYNSLLTGTPFKMYGMKEDSQNPYNVAMAAVSLTDIQVTSGNGAWGCHPDTTETWGRVEPFWDLLETIDWEKLIEARPWYAQELVTGEGVYAGYYIEPNRLLLFLANRSETAGSFDLRIDTSKLPKIDGAWGGRYVYGREGVVGAIAQGRLKIDLPSLREGPIGIEFTPLPPGRN